MAKTLTKQEKIAKINAQIAEAEESGEPEVYIHYLMRIREQTIHVYDGGTIIFQSGEPKNPPY